MRQWALPRGPLGRPAGRPSASPAAGAPARGGTTGGRPAGGPPPAGLAPPAACDPGAHSGPEAPTPGSELDLLQQQQLGFEHRPYGAGDPNGNSWSEKVNVWFTLVIANDQRDRRLNWETAQEGSLWRASFQVLPRPVPLREPWEHPVAYTGGFFRAKRDAKEDACRFLLEEQQRMSRLPDFIVPKPPLDRRRLPLDSGWRRSQPSTVVLGRRDPSVPCLRPSSPFQRHCRRGGSPEPGRRRRVPRHRRRRPQAFGRHRRPPWRHCRTPPARPASSATPLSPRRLQVRTPVLTGGRRRAARRPRPRAREVLGRPGRGSPAAASIRTSLVPSLAASSSPEPPPFPRLSSRGASCIFALPIPTPQRRLRTTGVVEWRRRPCREQDEEAKAALAAEELAAAELAPVPEEPEGDIAPEGGIGAQEWLGGPDPGSPGSVAQGYERLPLSPDKRPPCPPDV